MAVSKIKVIILRLKILYENNNSIIFLTTELVWDFDAMFFKNIEKIIMLSYLQFSI